MEKVYIINGIAKSGKDEFVKIFAETLQSNDKNSTYVSNLSTIDPVKSIFKQMGWNGEKDDKSRKVLSQIKKIWTDYNDGIFKQMCDNIDFRFKMNNVDINIVFIHCREPKEIRKFKKKFGELCETILVTRDSVEIPNNASDQSVFDMEYDKYIENNGTLDEYRKTVENFININIL